MKVLNKNISILSLMSVVLFLFMTTGCKKDDSYGPFDNASIETVISEAETLLANSTEGTLPGQYKPGSKKTLEDVVVWAKWKMDNSKSQDEISDAANKVQIYINLFKENVVAMAIPWIHQEPKTWIKIDDNTTGSGVAGTVNTLTKSSFTLEAWFYIIDLQGRGWSNELFSNAQGDGGANDRGFTVRYFGDGHIEFIVGGGSGWKEQKSAAGVLKSGEWMHVAFVNNITSQKLYVNGAEVLSQNETYACSDATFPLTIGCVKAWDDRTMNGMVKDFRLWSEARTSQQINDNKSAQLTGSESKLEAFFPFNSDLGKEFADISGKFKATFVGNVTWVKNGTPPVIEVDYSALNAAITSATTLKESITEGTNNGDYPVGTKTYIQGLIDAATALKSSSPKQYQVDDMTKNINKKIAAVKVNLVADANGIYIDRENPESVGLRITPNYTPQGDYTVEFEVNLKTLKMDGTGEFFNNGEFGLWVYGYKELTEENVLKSGGVWNFTSSSTGWTGPKSQPLVMKVGTWQHVAVVHDNTARTTAIYIDGVEVAKQTNIGVPNVSGWGEIWLGNGWGKINGTIKNFRLWNEAKSTSSLNASITGTESNLEIYLPLNKVAGVNFKDVTGRYNAELRGAAWKVQ